MRALAPAAQTAGRSASRATLKEEVESPPAQAGLIVHHPVEASVGHLKVSEDPLALQAGHSVHRKVLSEDLMEEALEAPVVVASPEDFMVAALGVFIVADFQAAFMAAAVADGSHSGFSENGQEVVANQKRI